jgi:signal transduction histidine kinase
MKTISLSMRLLLNTAAVLAAVFILAFAGYAATIRWGMHVVLKSELQDNAQAVIDGLRSDTNGALREVVLSPEKRLLYDALPRDFLYRVMNADGRLLFASDHILQQPSPGDQDNQDVAAITDTMFKTVTAGFPLYTLTVAVTRGSERYYVQVARSERFERVSYNTIVRKSWNVALWVSMLTLAIFGVVVWVTFKRALLPLRQASAAASQIAPDNLIARLNTRRMPAEVVPLVNAFNSALARIERGYQVQQEFLATAAHELKTPLALMRGQLELDGVADPATLLQDVDRMSRQVQQLLNLAECSERKNYTLDLVDMNEAVKDAAQRLARLSRLHNVPIDIVYAAGPTLIRADSGALFVLLKNLLENAIQHSIQGHMVRVVVTAEQVSVRNTGQAILEADMPMLFKRYWRGKHRNDVGAGLGLAICREIAEVHNWLLRVRNVALGPEFALLLVAGQKN